MNKSHSSSRVFFLIIVCIILTISIAFPRNNTTTEFLIKDTILASLNKNSVYSRSLETSTAKVYFEVLDLSYSNKPEEKFEANIEIYNNTNKEYEYEVRISGCSGSLIYFNEYEIEFSDSYSSGEHTQGKTTFYFTPLNRHTDNIENYVGTLQLYLEPNSYIEEGGILEITITVIEPSAHELVLTMVHQLEIS